MTVYEVIWIFMVPAILLSWYYLIKGWRSYIHKDYLMPKGPYPHIVFMITARKVTNLLDAAVKSIVSSCEYCEYTDYDIKVLADEDGRLDGAEHIIVPLEYRCNSRFKARALNYALQYLPNSKDVWTLHLDEDAEITPQTIMSILTYIKKGGKPVADGPTVFPYDNNLLTFFVEAQRCWTYLWVKDQLEVNRVLWMNGSNMLIRTDVEHAVGWNFKDCKFSEDTRFSYEAARKLGKVFGWHGGLTIEKPPQTAGAAIRQRKRWYWGGMLQLKQMSVFRLPRRIYSSMCWFLGFFLTLCIPVGIVNHFYPHLLFSSGVSFLTIGGISLAGVLWLLRYQLGLYWQLKYTPAGWLKKVGFHLVLLPLSPIIEFICTVPTLLAFINPPKVFQVTEKSGTVAVAKIEEPKELTGVGK